MKVAQEKLREEFGYNELKKKHKKSLRPSLPDLKVANNTPLSNTVGNGTVKEIGAYHPDAKQFPLYHSHKQGAMLMLPNDDPVFAGGKKHDYSSCNSGLQFTKVCSYR